MPVQLNHTQATKFYNLNLLEGVYTFAQYMAKVDKQSNLIPLDEDAENPAKNRNDFKGKTCFEVFGEYFIKTFQNNKHIAITDFVPNEIEDYGVDGTGLGFDGMPATVQFKYRSKVESPLLYKDIATFRGDSFENYGITKETSKNMLVVATTKEKHYVLSDRYHGRFIGFDHISALVDNNTFFWNDFADSLKTSSIKSKSRPIIHPFNHQLDCREKISDFLDQRIIDRAQIIMPTGSGKTLNEYFVVEDSINNGGIIHLFVAPRIALVHQAHREFLKFKKPDQELNTLVVCSGPGEVQEFYDGDEYEGMNNPTVDPRIIKLFVENSVIKDVPCVIFSTLQSAEKIKTALIKVNQAADVMICDEAHNLTRNDFRRVLDNDILPTNKRLFFTATRKISSSDKGRGMNNTELFGEVLYTISAAELIQKGLILPPRMHIINMPYSNQNEILFQENTSVDFRDQLLMVWEAANKHKEITNEQGDTSARIIVFCKSAEDAHDLAECQLLRDQLPGWYLSAVTSKKDRMKGFKRGEILQQFAKSDNALLFHYDVVGEGVDIPGTTAILVLRNLGEIKATQGIGRGLRVLPSDRTQLNNGNIQPLDSNGWNKPYGYVIIPNIPGRTNDAKANLQNIVAAFRINGYNIEEIMPVIDNPKGRNSTEIIFDPTDPSTDPINEFDFITQDTIDELHEGIDHQIEKEEVATLIQNISTMSDPVLLAALGGFA